MTSLANALHFIVKTPEWKKIQNAAAVHLICDPNSDDEETIFGLLVVDNTSGGFDHKLTSAILSIISTAIFYSINAAAVLEIAKSDKPNSERDKHEE